MEKVKLGDNVSVHYIGKLENGDVFDTSLLEGREPLSVTLGKKQLIKGFEDALIGMSIGERKTVEILPNEAYGEFNNEMIFEITKDRLPKEVKVGETLQSNTPNGIIVVRVVDIKENIVVLDANHPLSGKKLIFDLEIVDIKK
jgi:FKBP-type peptidyl-prolyl cis-trans isomerase SlpA